MRLKRVGKLFLIFILSLLPFGARSSEGMWVLDEKIDRKGEPRQFRVDPENNTSASAQFSENSLGAVLPLMKNEIWIVDLRRESHGFVNGIPVSWYVPQNQSNLNLTMPEIMQSEVDGFAEMAAMHREYPFYEVVDKSEGEILGTQKYILKLENVETEEALAKRLNLHYIRIPVSDHHRPNDAEVDQFLTFVKKLPPNAWLHFHCRGGKGRSTSFMAMYDILKHGKNQPLAEIIDRQGKLGGSKLFHISDALASEWKREAAIQRKAFLEAFYEYVNDPAGYPKVSWQNWSRNQQGLANPKN